MKIVYAGMKYDYGDPSRGFSFEHYNFFETLNHSDHDIIYFDFMSEVQERGKTGMNARLLDVVNVEKPDLLFTVLFTDQFDFDTIRSISASTSTTTFNWFCDDHWRFDDYSKHWAPAFNWVATTAASALPKYASIGYGNVIKTQWACNHFLYRKLDVPQEFDVSFVGQPHGTRKEVISRLRRKGIAVNTWGFGWSEGRLTQDEMIHVFNASKINLNLSNSSTGPAPGGLRKVFRRPPNYLSQIKGRNFEIPGCGGFLLTDPAENLDEYYTKDVEVAVFESPGSLVREIERYLGNAAARESIAAAGYERTLSEHTYERRFADIFTTMECPV